MPIEILKDKKILIVVPARYSSGRLPGKVMMKINDTPMFACIYNDILDAGNEIVKRCNSLIQIVNFSKGAKQLQQNSY